MNSACPGSAWGHFADAIGFELARQLVPSGLVHAPELFQPPRRHRVRTGGGKARVGHHGQQLQPLDGAGAFGQKTNGGGIADVAGAHHVRQDRVGARSGTSHRSRRLPACRCVRRPGARASADKFEKLASARVLAGGVIEQREHQRGGIVDFRKQLREPLHALRSALDAIHWRARWPASVCFVHRVAHARIPRWSDFRYASTREKPPPASPARSSVRSAAPGCGAVKIFLSALHSGRGSAQ